MPGATRPRSGAVLCLHFRRAVGKIRMGSRMEGHRVPLNFAFRGGRVVKALHRFSSGPRRSRMQKGNCVLAAEEEMGRASPHTFTGALRERALINVSAPAIITPKRVRLGAPAGVSMRELRGHTRENV